MDCSCRRDGRGVTQPTAHLVVRLAKEPPEELTANHHPQWRNPPSTRDRNVDSGHVADLPPRFFFDEMFRQFFHSVLPGPGCVSPRSTSTSRRTAQGSAIRQSQLSSLIASDRSLRFRLLSGKQVRTGMTAISAAVRIGFQAWRQQRPIATTPESSLRKEYRRWLRRGGHAGRGGGGRLS